ncbi:hypothetical protein EUZ85_15585 [Hahella sp. KA22]|uniref:hypothetical protein n=1 Tax=Hahella sp. KA22 TaxID=1628392 RepID=UPI000FDE2184|nr:hypothetical protein [Hahella sp. KA22]AZZ92069.1 hypothetical protein ENC22_13020 [Hahella sp. KA22]QAY55440.1 hypothetical protein EUZ85_15585 [Hahella sp. KA22]
MRLIKLALLSCLCIFTLPAFAEGKTDALICTMDINVWGNASICQCPEDEVYSEVTGTCLTQTAYNDLGRQGRYPQVCTRDLGAWGAPSHCSCDEGRVYSEESGACVTDVTPNIVTLSGKLVVTKPAKDIRFADISLRTPEGGNYLLNFSINQQDAMKLDGLWVEIVGEKVYLREGSMNSQAGTLITVQDIYWLD